MGKSAFHPYEIFTKLMSLGKSMRTHCHNAIEDDGFSLNETDVLLTLLSDPSKNTVKAISESSNISKGNISQAVELLRQKGYLEAEVSREDRRSVVLCLTDKAQPIIEKLQSAEEEYFSKFMVTLPQKEASLVTRIFNTLQTFSLSAFLNKLKKKEDKHE
jgi:DNA-binding MarR family transcriptional regulator